MFERYTEKARRVIFFARYEASQFGASQIEAEHLLLGLMREDKNLTARFFNPALASVESIRKEIEGRTTLHERISTSVDLPLSVEAKRALAFAGEESERLGHRHIGTEHLLLGLLRTEVSMAAEILSQRGLRLDDVRHAVATQARAQETGPLEIKPEEAQPLEPDDRWMWDVSDACADLGLLTPEEIASEFQRVAALRQFRPDAEALLRLLASKGVVDPDGLIKLAFELRNEERLRKFIEKLRGAEGAQ